jgi:hypothetical protein
LGDSEQAINNETEMKKASEIAQEMRELAGQGKYLIWGKNHPASLHQRIPKEFWVDNQIDFLRLAGDTAENVRTERATAGYCTCYSSLKVNKSQTERIWPSPTRWAPLFSRSQLAFGIIRSVARSGGLEGFCWRAQSSMMIIPSRLGSPKRPN